VYLVLLKPESPSGDSSVSQSTLTLSIDYMENLGTECLNIELVYAQISGPDVCGLHVTWKNTALRESVVVQRMLEQTDHSPHEAFKHNAVYTLPSSLARQQNHPSFLP